MTDDRNALGKDARAVEDAGRLKRSLDSTGLTLLFVVILLFCWADSSMQRSGSDPVAPVIEVGFWENPTQPWLLVAVIVLLGMVTCLRWCARTIFLRNMVNDSIIEQQRVREAPKVVPSGTIICCSGGGIKSASFCLGALQALNDPKFYPEDTAYQGAEAIIGVSGGGYIASAFSARQFHDSQLRVGDGADQRSQMFAPGSQEESELRRRTNYLASSWRVRFDLVASLLFGLFVNLLIVSAFICLLAWILVEQVNLVRLVSYGNTAETSDWVFNPGPNVRPLLELFWLPALLLATAAAYFFVSRFSRPWKRPQNCSFWQRIGEYLKIGRPAWNAWFSNTPNLLVTLGIFILLLYPGVPYVAVQIHNLWVNDLKDWMGNLQIAAIVTGVGTFYGMVRSATTPTGPKDPDSLWGQILTSFRLKVAPWFGVTLAAFAAYLLLVKLTASFISKELLPDWLWWSACVFLVVARLFVSANKTSMFPFYRGRLDFAFLRGDSDGASKVKRTSHDRESDEGQPHVGIVPDAEAGIAQSAAQAAGNSVLLAELAERRRGPQLVLCATANVKDGDLLPSGRNGTPFILSDAIGFTDTQLPGGALLLPVAEYVPGGGLQSMDIATAAAISGAAVAPLAGREDRALGAYRVLLALANIRLGVWVRNPYWTGQVKPTDSATARTTDFADAAIKRAGVADEAAAEARRPAGQVKLCGLSLQRMRLGAQQAVSVAENHGEQSVAFADAQGQARRELADRGAKFREAQKEAGQGATKSRKEARTSNRAAKQLRRAKRSEKPWSLRINDFLDLTSPYQVIQEAFGTPSIYSPYLYLTDGGHYDNLGLVEALRRRPKRIIMLDGSGDPEDKFPAMGDAIATARMDLGVEVIFKPLPLMRGQEKHPSRGWLEAEAKYQDGTPCTIHYVKCVLPAGLSWDLESYKLRDNGFPTTSTKYELYDEFDFEAYRRLGWSLVREAEKSDWGPTQAPVNGQGQGQGQGQKGQGRRGTGPSPRPRRATLRWWRS